MLSARSKQNPTAQETIMKSAVAGALAVVSLLVGSVALAHPYDDGDQHGWDRGRFEHRDFDRYDFDRREFDRHDFDRRFYEHRYFDRDNHWRRVRDHDFYRGRIEYRVPRAYCW
jgi:hypothetical protein